MSTVVGARERFVRRRRARRLRSARPLLLLLTVLAAAGLLVWVIWFSGLLAVRTVEVTGARAVPGADIEAAAAIATGRPLARVDTDAVRGRVAAIPGVASVRVLRSWPSTVRIVVTERTPLAAVLRRDELWLVDAGGVLFQRVPELPSAMPQLRVADPAPDDKPTRAALTVLDGLPTRLRALVRTVEAPTPESVQFTLRDDRTVVWGGTGQGGQKARVLEPLLRREGSYFDVSSPSVVVVR